MLPPDLAVNSALTSSPTSVKSQLSIADTLASGISRLIDQSESARFDAQLLLAKVLNVERSWLLAHPEKPLEEEESASWEEALARVEQGEVLPYVLGKWEFYGLPFKVTPDVLIPRPESEILVEHAIDWLLLHPDKRQAVDVGTGSACIAISIALNVSPLAMWASDISPAALAIAKENVERHHISHQVRLVQSDLLECLTGSFDLICANLPYIPSRRLESLAVSKREPLVALDGGDDGLSLIRPLLEQARSQLASGGLLLAEIDDSHRELASALASEHFPNAEVRVTKDLAGKARLLQVAT